MFEKKPIKTLEAISKVVFWVSNRLECSWAALMILFGAGTQTRFAIDLIQVVSGTIVHKGLNPITSGARAVIDKINKLNQFVYGRLVHGMFHAACRGICLFCIDL